MAADGDERLRLLAADDDRYAHGIG